MHNPEAAQIQAMNAIAALASEIPPSALAIAALQALYIQGQLLIVAGDAGAVEHQIAVQILELEGIAFSLQGYISNLEQQLQDHKKTR